MYNKLEILIDSIYNECVLLTQFTNEMKDQNSLGQSLEGIKTFRAICIGEQNIGEAVIQIGHLTQDRLFELYPSIDWKSIKGMKNRIVHEYLDIDEIAVISTAINDIPILYEVILSRLKAGSIRDTTELFLLHAVTAS